MCAHPVPTKLVMEKPVSTRWRNAVFYILLFALYLCLNSILNIANRWALGISGFAFPILLTMAHAIFSFSVLGPVLSALKVDHATTLRKSWPGVLVIGVLMGCNIACNNLSLVHLPLSLNQVTRASLPVVTAAVAVLVERKVPTREECGALMLLTMGVTVTVFEGKATGSGSGLMLCVAGVLCAAAMLSTAGWVLSEKMDVLQLTFYTAPVSCTMLFPFYLVREHANFMVYLETNQRGVALIIAFSSIVALAYNVTHNYLLQRTSAVTVTVLGEVKIVGLLLLSAMLLPGESNHFTLKMTVGCILAIAGFCLYSNAKIAAQKMPPQPTAAPDPATFSQEKLLEVRLVVPPAASEKRRFLGNASKTVVLSAIMRRQERRALPIKTVQLITTEGKGQVTANGKHAPRVCQPLPFLRMLGQVAMRRNGKASKFPPNGTAFVVADSTTKDLEGAPLLHGMNGLACAGGGTTISSEPGTRFSQATIHSGYENVGGPLTHVNGKTPFLQNGKNGFHAAPALEPGKVRSVPDHSVLNLPESMHDADLAPRSYEALQMFDSAPRGYSLIQPS